MHTRMFQWTAFQVSAILQAAPNRQQPQRSILSSLCLTYLHRLHAMHVLLCVNPYIHRCTD